MNFIERTNPDTKTTVMASAVPYVLIDTIALQKMFTYTDLCADEVGWLGTAVREDNEVHITDVFLFGQEVHATTTEITPEGLESFATEILEQPNGVETWNNLKVWGHSHVNMGITPSGQDDKQMEEFANIGHDWFIRLICNKKGEFSVDVYDYKAGLIFKNVAWERLVSDEEEAFNMQIMQLQEQLNALTGAKLEELQPAIKEEMTLKVHKKSYATSYTRGTGARTGYVNSFGRYVDGVWSAWGTVLPTEEEMRLYEDHIPVQAWNDACEFYAPVITTLVDSEKKTLYSPISVIHDDEDVFKFFNTAELATLAWSVDEIDLAEQMDEHGYENQFSKQDIGAIFRVAISEARNSSWGMTNYDEIY